MSVKSTFSHSFIGILVTLSRHFMPHVGRVNKSSHHSHASMRGGGLLTLYSSNNSTKEREKEKDLYRA